MESKIDNFSMDDGNDYNNISHLAINDVTDISKVCNMDAELANSTSNFKSNTETTSASNLNINKMNSEQQNTDSDAKELYKPQTGESLLQTSQNLLQSKSDNIAASRLYPNQMNTIIPSNWKNRNVSNSRGNFILESPYSDSSCDSDQIDKANLQIHRLENALNEDYRMQDDEDLQIIRKELHNQLKNHQCNNDIIEEVTLALNRFELSLKAGKFSNTNQEKKKLLLSLINSLQTTLKPSTKPNPETTTSLLYDFPDNAAAKGNSHQRFGKCRNRSHRHTIGVSYKELADARECIEKMQTDSNSPPYEETNSNINNINKFLNYDLPNDDMRTVCHQMNPNNTEQHLLNNNGNNDIPTLASRAEDFGNQRYFMKRANTVDIAKMKNSTNCNNRLNNLSSNGRYSDTNFKSTISANEKKRKEEKKSIIPPLIPKTLNDIKFLAFINKQNDKANMGWNGARTNSNWTDKFYYIKKSFESAGNSPNTINAQISLRPLQAINASSPSYQLKGFHQNKYETKTASVMELKQKSEPKSKLKFNQTLTLKNSVPSIINQFKHAAHSVFKPMPYLKATGRLLGTSTFSKENNNANKNTNFDNRNLPNTSKPTSRINYKNYINNNDNNNNNGNDTVNEGKTNLKRNMSLYQPNTNRIENEAYRRRFSVSENSSAIYNPTYRNSEVTSLEALPPPININFCYATQSAHPNRVGLPTKCFSSSPALKSDYKRLDAQRELKNTFNQGKQVIPTNPEPQPIILTYNNPKFDCQDYYHNDLLTNYNSIRDNDTTPTCNSGEKNNLAEFCAVSRIMEKPQSHKATTTLKQLSHIHDSNDEVNSKQLRKNLLDIRNNNVRPNNFHSSLPSIQMTPNDNTYTSYSVVHSTPNNLDQLNVNQYYNDDRAMHQTSTVSQKTCDESIDFNNAKRNEPVNNSFDTPYSNRMNPDFLSDMQSLKPQNCTSHCNQVYAGYQNTLLAQNNQLNKVTPYSYITETRRPNTTKFMSRGMKFQKQSENNSKQIPAYEINKQNPKYQRQEQPIYINSENDAKSIITSDAPDVVKSSLQFYDRNNENSYHKSYTFDSKLATKTKENTMKNIYYPSHPLPANGIVYNNVQQIESSALRQHNIGNIHSSGNVHPSSYDNALRRTKSGINTYIVPKKYEAGISKADIVEKQRTVAAYFSGQPLLAHKPSQQTPMNYSPLIYNAANHQTNRERVMASADGNQNTSKTPSIKIMSKNQKHNHEMPEGNKSLATLTNAQAQSLPKQTICKYGGNALNSRAITAKEQLLNWCRSKTEEYPNVEIKNFSSSWSDGLAFCALIHHFLPDAFDYNELTVENRRKNFELAFTIAEEKAGIAPLLDVDDMVNMKRPDWKCVFVYVQSIHHRFRNSL